MRIRVLRTEGFRLSALYAGVFALSVVILGGLVLVIINQALRDQIMTFSATDIAAIRAILDSPDMRLDGFIGPGHVSTVIGCRPYEWIARDEKKPIVVSGDADSQSPLDIDAIKGGVPERVRVQDTKTPLGNLRPN